MNLNKWLPVGVLVMVLILAGAGFLYFQGQRPVAPTTEAPAPVGGGAISEPVTGTTAEEEATGAGEAMEEVREVTVEGDEYAFAPTSLTFSSGERVRLTFNNVGRFSHNLTVEGLGVATKTIPGGQSDTVEFTVEEAGSYTYYCSVGNHRAQGMEGDLSAE